MSNMFQHALPGPDDIHRHTLNNGITVLVRENFHAQSVVMTGGIPAGAVFEAPEKQGLAGFTCGALMRGTMTHDFASLHESLESVGANMSVSGGMHYVSFGGKGLGEDLALLLTLLSDVLRNPAFPEKQVKRLQGELLTGLKMRQQNTRFMAGRLFRKLAYPTDHPYHRGTIGEIETIQAITTEDLRAYHRQHFGPQGMVLVIVGHVKAAQAIEMAENAFGDWSNPQQPDPPVLQDVPKLEGIHHDAVLVPGKSQSDIILGVPGPSRYADDFQAARLANHILGLFGMYGRLGKIIREKHGLAYYSYSQMHGTPGPAAWRVVAGVDPQNVAQTVQSVREEVRRMMNDPIDADELADNKSHLTGVLPLQLESNEGVALTLYNMERYQLGLDYLLRYTDIVNSLDAAQVQTAMAHYWSTEAFALAIAGPQLTEEVL